MHLSYVILSLATLYEPPTYFGADIRNGLGAGRNVFAYRGDGLHASKPSVIAHAGSCHSRGRPTSRTPGPPPFASMNSTPSASRVRRMV